ncbi:response regulator transcription factor [Paenibacillus anaericanus]|uniref:Response regulator transcription factor n=1 Tax=Paenibacillus anaericanus TaxID=170367 RepID=A0A433Y552_9BACL|nr:response regulator transcription factor [Paenibacillus anaericanus]RUT43417.1 response regulator transcription factor [Paenibacillus anaericanus]
MEYTIFIVEDDLSICRLLKEHIEKYGFSVKVVQNFEQVVEEFSLHRPSLVLLDVNLPKFDGFYWCRRIREISKAPILFISARESGMDQVMALENGADDYITKPFSYEVIMAKIKSHLRRAYGDYARSNERVMTWEELTLYPERLELEFKGQALTLTKKEALLLESLIQFYPNVVYRNYLLEKMWDDSQFVEENTLNVNVTRLKKKMQELGIQNGIITIRGLGYKLNKCW